VSLEWAILALRVAAVLLLYAFLGAALFVIWWEGRAAAGQVERARSAAARPLGRLVVVQGGATDLSPGQAFALNVMTGLGRGPSNTVIVEDPFASTEHALLYRRDERWWLEDLNSRNGTLLNGERLRAPAIVATGDEVGIGGVRMRIELEADE
jgi:pSer/pThr/pTyr-binding forkhead associated (FHA) protein